MNKEERQALYEALREYLSVLNKKSINEPFYVTDVREAKVGKLYQALHRFEDEYGPFRWYQWV